MILHLGLAGWIFQNSSLGFSPKKIIGYFTLTVLRTQDFKKARRAGAGVSVGRAVCGTFSLKPK